MPKPHENAKSDPAATAPTQPAIKANCRDCASNLAKVPNDQDPLKKRSHAPLPPSDSARKI